MTTFWGCAKTNEWSQRHMTATMFKRTVKRGSKRATAEAYAAFCAFLATHVPHDGATALFEETDRNGYNVTRVTFTGKPDAFAVSRDGYNGTPIGGVWYLEEGPEGLQDMVRAGRAVSTPAYETMMARRVQG